MSYIFLGNLSIEEIEKRTGIILNDKDREYMKSHRQENVSVPLESGAWHGYDMPFMIMTGDKNTAEMYNNMLSAYDWSKCKEALQIAWGRQEE